MKPSALLIGTLLLCTACADDDPTYPPILTEMTDALTDNEGTLFRIVTDRGTVFDLSNPQRGFDPNAVYRTLSGYVIDTEHSATLYQLQGALVLADSSTMVRTDPTDILSAWRAGRYINLHLKPLTQGGTQHWGYAVEHLAPQHFLITLHHRQNADPPSYSRDIYASIPVNNIPNTLPGDTLTLSVATYKGTKTWTFTK